MLISAESIPIKRMSKQTAVTLPKINTGVSSMLSVIILFNKSSRAVILTTLNTHFCLIRRNCVNESEITPKC